jgi:hypothetical protein
LAQISALGHFFFDAAPVWARKPPALSSSTRANNTLNGYHFRACYVCFLVSIAPILRWAFLPAGLQTRLLTCTVDRVFKLNLQICCDRRPSGPESRGREPQTARYNTVSDQISGDWEAFKTAFTAHRQLSPLWEAIKDPGPGCAPSRHQ